MLTSEIKVNGMGKESFARNAFEKRDDRNELKMNGVGRLVHRREPLAMATCCCTSSSLWTYHYDSLNQKTKPKLYSQKSLKYKILIFK